MKKISLFLLFLAIQLSSFATDFQGIISANTTWTKANSPYKITGRVQVNPGVLLTVEPGVEVLFQDFYSFDIGGSIYAVGTAAEPITFMADSTTYWKGINFVQYSPNDSGIFHHCIIKRCGPSAIKSQAYVYVNMQQCYFEQVMGAVDMAGKLIFKNNSVINSSNGAITNSTDKSEIIDNIFNVSGQGIGAVANDQAGYIVTGNKVSGAYYGMTMEPCSNCIVDSNILTNNQNGLVFQHFQAPIDSSILPATNNIIAFNKNGVHAGHAAILLKNNTIKRNEVGIYSSSSRFNPSFTHINYNCIDSNLTNLVIEDNSGWGTHYDLSNNFWGSTVYDTIRNSILDGYSDFHRDSADILPFLMQPDASCQIVDTVSTDTSLSITNLQYQAPMSVSVYPNPFTAAFTIHTDGSTPINEVAVYNMVGSNIKTIKTKDTKVDIDLSSYPAGIYIYTIRFADNRIYTGKIQKTN